MRKSFAFCLSFSQSATDGGTSPREGSGAIKNSKSSSCDPTFSYALIGSSPSKPIKKRSCWSTYLAPITKSPRLSVRDETSLTPHLAQPLQRERTRIRTVEKRRNVFSMPNHAYAATNRTIEIQNDTRPLHTAWHRWRRMALEPPAGLLNSHAPSARRTRNDPPS